MQIISEKFKIEATYDELLFMYEGMMKILDEAPEKNTQEWIDKDRQCFELSIVLGKRNEFLKLRDTYKIES